METEPVAAAPEAEPDPQPAESGQPIFNIKPVRHEDERVVGVTEVIQYGLAKALDALGLRRMVVGHTPQITAGINACCGGRVYRIDTGLSSFYGGMKQCLEVVSNERPRVISSTPEYFW